MRIVFVNSNPFWGGAEKWHVATAAFMKAHGHDVRFVASSDEIADRVNEAGVPVAKLGFRSDIDPTTLFRLCNAFREFGPDAVVLNSERDLRLGGSAAAFAHVKVRIHRKGISGVKNNPRYRWTYRHLRTHTLCVANAVRDEIVKLNWVPAETLRVIHSGVDIDKFTPEGTRNLRAMTGADDGEIVIGAVARISSIKGFEYLIQAMPEILEVHGSVKCLLVGEGRLGDELKALANRLGVDKSVIFAGFQRDSADAVRSLDIVAHPSVHTEGLPNSLLEAMACGKPVVATPIAGIPEAVEDGITGIMVPPRDSHALAEAVIRLISDKKLRDNFSRAARERAIGHFNSNTQMAEFEGWVREITGAD